MNRKNIVNCITINSDASHCPKTKVGGFASYIVCDNFKIMKGGLLKGKIKNSIEAELMAIANSIYLLSKQNDLPMTKLIVINCDCLAAFERIGRKKRNHIGRQISALLRYLKKQTSINGVIPKIEFRHVKAHNGTNDSRSYVNDWCDKEAKKYMRKERDSINKNENS